MNKKDIIRHTDELLKGVPGLKEEIKIIDKELDKETYEEADRDKLVIRRNELKEKLSTISKAIIKLNDTDQRIICCRYFDKLKYEAIAPSVGYSKSSLGRRIKKVILLDIGRSIFGVEDEFWKNIIEDM